MPLELVRRHTVTPMTSRVRKLVVSVAVAASTFAAGSLVIVNAGENEPQEGVEAARSLNCAAGPIFVSFHRDYPGGRTPPTYRTARRALQEGLDEDRPNLEETDFEEIARSNDEVQFTIERNGRQASALVARIGDRWALDDLVVCDDFPA